VVSGCCRMYVIRRRIEAPPWGWATFLCHLEADIIMGVLIGMSGKSKR